MKLINLKLYKKIVKDIVVKAPELKKVEFFQAFSCFLYISNDDSYEDNPIIFPQSYSSKSARWFYYKFSKREMRLAFSKDCYSLMIADFKLRPLKLKTVEYFLYEVGGS